MVVGEHLLVRRHRSAPGRIAHDHRRLVEVQVHAEGMARAATVVDLDIEDDYRGSSGHALGMYLDLNQPAGIVPDSTRRGAGPPNEQGFAYHHFGQAPAAESIA